MNTAIIAEYNPLHKGHIYHIDQTHKKGAKNIIVIMSGNFVQRGEPAILSKYTRAANVLKNGADMVIELPVEYATSAADVFAFGGCDIIKKSGICDSISFGCENQNIADFHTIADLLNDEPYEFKEMLKKELSKGVSYPTARAVALEKYTSINTDFMNRPNNILALEYMRNLRDSDIKPILIERKVSDYNDTNMTGEFSSAAAIRHNLAKGDDVFNSVPGNTVDVLRNIKHIPHIDDYSDILHYILRTDHNIEKYADITEGLDNRIIKASQGQKISQLIMDIKTKRYTYTKIKRAIVHILLGITKADQDMTGVKYIRVLGVRKDKINLLSELSEKSKVPLITNVAENSELLRKEIVATDIYNMFTTGEKGQEYREKFIIL